MTIRISSRAVLFVGFLVQGSLVAQRAHTADSDSTGPAQSGIYPVPVLYYTPETGFAGGAAAMYLYRDSPSQRASNLAADIIYTAKK